MAARAQAEEAVPSEYAQLAYKAGEEAYRRGNFADAASRFEQAYQIAKFPTILFDVAQAYRRLYETEHSPVHLEKAIRAYRSEHRPRAMPPLLHALVRGLGHAGCLRGALGRRQATAP